MDTQTALNTLTTVINQRQTELDAMNMGLSLLQGIANPQLQKLEDTQKELDNANSQISDLQTQVDSATADIQQLQDTLTQNNIPIPDPVSVINPIQPLPPIQVPNQ